MAVWHAQRTLLIVGEGRHETAFLNHVKQLYVQRGCGLAVAIKNARGKGAKHVIEWAARQVANTAYDTVAAMLDTDEDWSPALATQARTKKIQVLASDPCFDAVMLRLLGQRAVGDAKALKKMLAPYLDHDPTQPQSYAAHFDKACLDKGRQREPTIDRLLQLLGV